MSTLSLLKALHIFGAIVWIGGVVAVALAALALGPSSAKEGAAALRGAARKLAVPGMLLAWVGGLGLIAVNFAYMKMGWLHPKLLLVLIASGLTGAITAKLGKVEAGSITVEESKLRALGVTVLVLAFLTVALASLRPF